MFWGMFTQALTAAHRNGHMERSPSLAHAGSFSGETWVQFCVNVRPPAIFAPHGPKITLKSLWGTIVHVRNLAGFIQWRLMLVPDAFCCQR